MVTAARARVPSNVTVVQADVLRDPLPGNSFDAIVSMSVLHHLPIGPVLQRLAAAHAPAGCWPQLRCPVSTFPGSCRSN